MDGSHWTQPRLRRGNIDKDSIMCSKSAYRKGVLGVGDSAVVIPAASLIVIMLDCCNFCTPPRQWFFAPPQGTPGSAAFPTRACKDICPHLRTNKLTGFQSHCQSLNLCLKRRWVLQWASAPSRVCVRSVFTWPRGGLAYFHCSQHSVADGTSARSL